MAGVTSRLQQRVREEAGNQGSECVHKEDFERLTSARPVLIKHRLLAYSLTYTWGLTSTAKTSYG